MLRIGMEQTAGLVRVRRRGEEAREQKYNRKTELAQRSPFESRVLIPITERNPDITVSTSRVASRVCS